MQFECSKPEWKEVDRRLAAIAKQRAGLDAEEARWLREAARVRIWREVGCSSLLDYLERRLGYAPRTAQERVRVAMALAELPTLEAALAAGMPYTAVREITRVATPETEEDWIDACRGATVREVEAAVAGHRKGSRPSDPADPDLEARPLTFEGILPSTMALLRQVRQKAQAERGEHLSDDDLLAAVFGAFIEGNGANGATSEERVARARFQIAMVLCEQCEQGWQEGAGRRFAMEKAEVERARCDAQYIGSLDRDPERATQDVPPRVRRFVFRRDGGRCRVPGCRSSAHLEVHHIEARAAGGNHEPSNLILLCDGCHTALHREHIQISGTAENLVVKRRHSFGLESPPPDVRAHVGAPQPSGSPREGRVNAGSRPASEHDGARAAVHAGARPRSRFEQVAIRTQALDALVQAGFRRHEARTAVDAAVEQLGETNTTLESFLRVALSKAPRPRHG